jgi:hypothetical protein
MTIRKRTLIGLAANILTFTAGYLQALKDLQPLGGPEWFLFAIAVTVLVMVLKVEDER